MPILAFPIGGSNPTRFLLAPGIYTVGRQSESSIVMDHDSVSDRHCELTVYASGECVIRDAGSERGTHLDGRRISVATLLPGQTFTVGEIPVGIEAEPEPEPVPLSTEFSESWAESRVTSPGREQMADSHGATLWGSIPGAFHYALRGQLGIVIAVFTGIFCVGWILPPTLASVVSILGIFGGLYLLQLGRDIVLTTANGEDDPPPNPDLVCDWDELKERVFLYAGVVLVSFAPFTATQLVPDCPFWVQATFACFGSIYFPMALLGVALADQPGPLLPTFVFRSIGRVLGAYWVVVIGFAVAFGPDVAFDWARDQFGLQRGAQAGLALVVGSVGLYLKLVWLRVLGLMYWFYRDNLAWEF